MQAPQRAYIEGYHSQIHRSLWQRILTWGVPRMWAGLWLLLCLMGTAWSFVIFEQRLYLIPMLLWFVGQAVLKALTRWDVQFDQVAKAKPRYKTYYEAG